MSLISIIIFVAVLVVLILVHELGHFLSAKKLGIRVDEFGIGFPPRIFSKKYGETRYSINSIPFGGFVKIFGEDPTEEGVESGEDAKRAFVNQSRPKQAIVLVSGVLGNIIFAWLLFVIALSFGMNMPSTFDPIVGEVQDKNIVISNVLEGSPAGEAGIKQGDEVLSLSSGDESIVSPSADDVQGFVSSRGGEDIVFNYERDGEEMMSTVTPEVMGSVENEDPVVGIGMAERSVLKLPVHLAIIEAGHLTVSITSSVVTGLYGLIHDAIVGSANFENVAGPVGIASLVADATAKGAISLFVFTAFISLNLAVINLIPFPALDGGRLLFTGIEGVIRRRIKPSVFYAANFIGFVLLIILMLVVTYNDIAKMVS